MYNEVLEQMMQNQEYSQDILAENEDETIDLDYQDEGFESMMEPIFNESVKGIGLTFKKKKKAATTKKKTSKAPEGAKSGGKKESSNPY